MRQYTGNRVGLAIVGATLLGLGAYAWLRGEDRFLGLPPGARVLPAQAYRTLAEEPWPLWFLALGLLLLTLVCLRWLLQQNVSAIPRTSKLERLQENIDIFDFELSDEDMREISAMGSGNAR